MLKRRGVKKFFSSSLISFTLLFFIPLFSIPLDPNPSWYYSCPASRDIAFGDVNNDGYLDLAVVREGYVNYLFRNLNGRLDSSPSWQSNDVDYTISCAFGDVDNDGYLDLAVGNYRFAGGRVKLYKNENGNLNPEPRWIAEDDGATSLAWGDVDNDGDLDLAGVDLFGYPCLFFNNEGQLERNPSWRAVDHNLDLSCAFVDIDNDGWLDLVVGNVNWAIPLIRIYKNNNGRLETRASWRSILPQTDYVSADGIAVGDVNNDGWLDIFVSNHMNEGVKNYGFINNQGRLDTFPNWLSNDENRSIRSYLADMDGDEDLDFAYANVGQAMVYENINGSLNPTPAWSSNVSHQWGIAVCDIDNDGLILKRDTFIGNGQRKLFYLKKRPVQRLVEIRVNNNPIPVSNYAIDLYNGWFTLKETPLQTSQIVVTYYYSLDLDLAFGGCYLFLNRRAPEIKEKENITKNILNLKEGEIYNILGNKIKRGDLKKGIYFLKKEKVKEKILIK
ncbi:MAG: VCBS repeat-containing protein [candidate division WOR-3 bacterium]|nr:VCBS repeat-containing protein [candidate division WOR-3 bacterium]